MLAVPRLRKTRRMAFLQRNEFHEKICLHKGVIFYLVFTKSCCDINSQFLEYSAFLCRHVSNCDGDTPPATNVDEGATENQGETVVTPPDNMLAEEMAEGPQDFTQARAINSIGEAVKAVSTGVHLQDPRKQRLTPAARQRKDIQNTMLSYIQRTATDADASDDELDLAFSSMAKRMCLHLSKTQKEQVLFKIQNVVDECINKVPEGNTVNDLLKQTDLQLLEILCTQILQMLLLETNLVSSQANNNSQLVMILQENSPTNNFR